MTISEITLKLPYHPPYNWNYLMYWWKQHLTSGVEVITKNEYRRVIELDGEYGLISVTPAINQPYLLAKINFPNPVLIEQIVERLHLMFDLKANIEEIITQLQKDSLLAIAIQNHNGLRIPGCWDGFEVAVRTILGQQISVAAATTLTKRLVQVYGQPLSLFSDNAITHTFPQPIILAEADLTGIGVTRPRAKAISNLALTIIKQPTLLSSASDLELTIKQLCQLPGIGEWSAHYIALRALRQPDAFPASDLGLLRSIAKLGQPMTKAALVEYSQRWQPWRGYAAMYLWAFDAEVRS